MNWILNSFANSNFALYFVVISGPALCSALYAFFYIYDYRTESDSSKCVVPNFGPIFIHSRNLSLCACEGCILLFNLTVLIAKIGRNGQIPSSFIYILTEETLCILCNWNGKCKQSRDESHEWECKCKCVQNAELYNCKSATNLFF